VEEENHNIDDCGKNEKEIINKNRKITYRVLS